MIVDPSSNTVMARGHSLTDDNPLMHATMVGINLVSRSHGGGLWDTQGGNEHRSLTPFTGLALLDTYWYLYLLNVDHYVHVAALTLISTCIFLMLIIMYTLQP